MFNILNSDNGGVRKMNRIEYKPRSVREILTEMKDITDVMIDLAIAAVQFENKEIAKQVRKLEAQMEDLMYQIGILATVSVRNVEEGEMMTGVLRVANAAKAISDATGGLCDPILRNMSIHPIIKTAIDEAEEKTDMVKIAKKSILDGHKLGNLNLPANIGTWVLAVKRNKKWVVPPNKSTQVKAGSTLVVRGSEEGIEMFRKMAGAQKASTIKSRKFRELTTSLSSMRDMICSMVAMAYSSVLFGSRGVAEEVRELEQKFDEYNYKIPSIVLKAAKREKDTDKLNSILQFVKSMEKISDGADAIVDVVLRRVEIHPIFAQALEEADEQILRIRVSKKSDLVGHTFGKLNLEVRTGADVFTIKRGDRYIFNPGEGTTIRAGDVLLIRGSEEGVERLERIAMGADHLPEMEEQ